MLTSRAARKVDFLFRTRTFFIPAHLFLYKAQNHPTLKYCSHMWGGASSIFLTLLGRVQRKTIRLIFDLSLPFDP